MKNDNNFQKFNGEIIKTLRKQHQKKSLQIKIQGKN